MITVKCDACRRDLENHEGGQVRLVEKHAGAHFDTRLSNGEKRQTRHFILCGDCIAKLRTGLDNIYIKLNIHRLV